jgi:DNA-binding NarL/FixJ family response regulator
VTELTGRERQVLALMAEGRSNQGICDRLFLSHKTVEAHVKHIFAKLGLEESPDNDRRVLAVIAYLRSSTGCHRAGWRGGHVLDPAHPARTAAFSS